MSKYQKMRAIVDGRELPQKIQLVEWSHCEKGKDSGYKPVPGVFVDIDGHELTVADLERIAFEQKKKLKIIYD